MKIENILAGIDFENSTETILGYASYFAETFGASLTLLHVLDYLITPPAYLVPYVEKERELAEKKFDSLKKELADSGVNALAEIMAGRLRESFDAAIRSTKADMLVLGFASHVLRRGSSEKLIKGLRIPMLVVRGEKSVPARIGSLKMGKILCPVDFSGISERALDAAKELADKLSARLEILHVFPSHSFDAMKGLEIRDRILKEMYDEARGNLEKFVGASGFGDAGFMEEGEPYKKIIASAKERDIDLIVLGARGLGRIEGMLIGSVTDAVLKSAPCPVLVIH